MDNETQPILDLGRPSLAHMEDIQGESCSVNSVKFPKQCAFIVSCTLLKFILYEFRSSIRNGTGFHREHGLL